MATPIFSQRALCLLIHQTFRTCSPQATRAFSVAPHRHVGQSAIQPADNAYIPFEADQSSQASSPSTKTRNTSPFPSRSPVPATDTPDQIATSSRNRKPRHTSLPKHAHAKPTPNPTSQRPNAPPKDAPPPPRPREPWQAHKAALAAKLGNAPWNPPKKLSPDALEGIRALHAQYPAHFTTPVLAAHFEVSPEAIRRILKSKWRPTGADEEDRLARWERRGERAWRVLSETKGVHPPRKWREKGIGRQAPRRPSAEQWTEILKNKEAVRAAINAPRPKAAEQKEPTNTSWVEPRPR